MEWINKWLRMKSGKKENEVEKKIVVISQLAKFGIITCDPNREMITIHRLNKATILKGLSPQECEDSAKEAEDLVLSIGQHMILNILYYGMRSKDGNAMQKESNKILAENPQSAMLK